MRLTEAKQLFKNLTTEYFSQAIVIFANQSRIAKPTLPLITISTLNPKRQKNPVYKMVDGVLVGHYETRLPIQVDLFTKGAPVMDGNGKVFAYEDTATEDLTAFVDFLESLYVLEWSHINDVSIDIEGDVQNLTGIVNDTNYEYRARVTVLFYYTHKTVGSTSVLKEVSIQYPEDPLFLMSNTGSYSDEAEKRFDDTTIDPVYGPTSTGGGSEELAANEIGYFTEVEIKEEEETVNE